jgi:hypothetical protein
MCSKVLKEVIVFKKKNPQSRGETREIVEAGNSTWELSTKIIVELLKVTFTCPSAELT